ncbi:Cyclic GMP-AMP synthase [Mizuhopecten yessoensis]|uniref:Cyclic GMP-AMP synthase n=1 Tax=Mizuhopecten yessoensis TaxID=6573 RepID=A0A210Q1A5_MIZYE|nr:Cyclic GMP-AMP synthase [Mizuhopecten yessoensis]
MELGGIRKVSKFLSQHLDAMDSVGCEESVGVRRLMSYLAQVAGDKSKKGSSIMTGSKSEGFNFSSSDMDMMIVINEVKVVQPHDDIQEGDVNHMILVTDDTGCRPGYTLLRLYKEGVDPDKDVMSALADVNGSLYLSSLVYINNVLPPNCYQHGPCSSLQANSKNKKEIDIAFSFHCRSWPDSLSDFRSRTIYCRWPSRDLVNYIVRDGCYFVAIGDKHSSMNAMQWRISFAKAEKSLVMSFNHVQFKTYALLKIFLKECLEREESIKDLLCSYFMKTIMFHAIEHSTSSMWVDENIVQCFWFCFTILLEFVQTGYCPNYFVLTHNMFLSNVTGDNRRRLLHVLNKYQCMGWKCLFQCPSLQSLPQIIHESRSVNPVSTHKQMALAEINRDLLIHTQHNSIGFHDIAAILKIINGAFLKCSGDLYSDIVLLATINAVTNTSGNSIADLTRTQNIQPNKVVYNLIRREKQLLHLSAATDVCVGLLSLATFYYNTGCYNKASKVAIRVVSACQQRALIEEHGEFSEYFEEMCGKRYTLLQKAQRSFVFVYKIQAKYNTLYPPELDIEVQATEDNHEFIYLPPLPYAIFLVVLSMYRLNSIGQARVLLDALMTVRSDEVYGVLHYPILHNLVGICHQLLGNTRQAIMSFEDSCRQLPDNGAAASRITELRRHQREERDNSVD